SLEAFDRFHTGSQNPMGRVRPVGRERFGQDRVLRVGGDELVDVRGKGARLLRGDEPRPYADRGGAGRERGGHRPPRADPAGGDAPMPLTIPRPPASATAVAKAGEAILPIPACCNGTVHPSNSVNFV